MLSKDYFIRQIERVGVMLVAVRDLIHGGEHVRALAELQQAAVQAGVEVQILDILTAESLLDILGQTSLHKLLPAAEILLLKAELEASQGQTGAAAQSLAKAVFLTEELKAQIGDGSDPMLQDRLQALLERLEEAAR